MPSLIWTPAALADMQRLYQFLANIDSHAAQLAIATIRERVQSLENHPNLGRSITDLTTDYRELLIAFGKSGYALIYHLDHQHIVILAVKHQKEIGYSTD